MTPLVVVALGALLLAVPAFPTACPVRLLFHAPCPSCGLTRAARLALGGEFSAASRVHPLWIVVLPFLGIVGLAESVAYVRSGAWGAVTGRRGVKRAAQGIGVALVVVWVARWMGAFGGPVGV